MNGSRNKGGSWIKCCVELNRNIWYIFQEHDTRTIYAAISRNVTSRHEATALGIHLGIHPDDVTYCITNHDVMYATYRFLWLGRGQLWTCEKVAENHRSIEDTWKEHHNH